MKHYHFFLFPIFAVFFLLNGCAKNIVHLSYPDTSATIRTTPPSRGTICVVDFANRRNRAELGLRKSGASILPRTSVERWVATGLGEEMRRAGFTVIMAESMAEAFAASPKYILTGDLEEASLMETFLARYTATIRANIILCNSEGSSISSSSHSSSFSSVYLPFGDVPQSLLDDALFEMLQPAVRQLSRSMQ